MDFMMNHRIFKYIEDFVDRYERNVTLNDISAAVMVHFSLSSEEAVPAVRRWWNAHFGNSTAFRESNKR
jgi:hypothetical protein